MYQKYFDIHFLFNIQFCSLLIHLYMILPEVYVIIPFICNLDLRYCDVLILSTRTRLELIPILICNKYIVQVGLHVRY